MSEIPSNMVTWFQIPADDPARAWRFYGEVFGWNPGEAYADRKRFGAINGAIGERESEGDTPRLVIRVDDVEATARSIGKAGGQDHLTAIGNSRHGHGLRGLLRHRGKCPEHRG